MPLVFGPPDAVALCIPWNVAVMCQLCPRRPLYSELWGPQRCVHSLKRCLHGLAQGRGWVGRGREAGVGVGSEAGTPPVLSPMPWELQRAVPRGASTAQWS